MKILIWIKDKAVWMLGFLVALLGVLFAVKYERKKIEILKRTRQIDTARQAIEMEHHKKESTKAEEAILAGKDESIAKEIQEGKDEIKKIKDEIKEMDNDEIVSEFNVFYGRTSRVPRSRRPGRKTNL
jgi:hypothetical protein